MGGGFGPRAGVSRPDLGGGNPAQHKTQDGIALVLARAVVDAFDSRYGGWGSTPPEFDHAQGFELVADSVLQQFGRTALAHAGGWALAAGIDLSEWEDFAESALEAVGAVNLFGERT